MATMGKFTPPPGMEYEEAPDENHCTYVYEKNRRYGVDKGTRCAHVQESTSWEVRSVLGVTLARLQLAERLTLQAVHLWEQRWGELDWWTDCPQFLVTHTSIQVLVEMRVDPR